jgi:serine/threonine protein kinase
VIRELELCRLNSTTVFFPSARTMDNYEQIKELGSGNFGVTHLMKDKTTSEYVAVKKLPRGSKINKNVYREVLNHRKLSHPNIIGFKCVLLDDTHLNILMEYAEGASVCLNVFTFTTMMQSLPPLLQ